METRKKNVAKPWANYKKAYDIIPQTFIIKCLKISNVNICTSFMENRKVELAAEIQAIAEVKFKELFSREINYLH